MRNSYSLFVCIAQIVTRSQGACGHRNCTCFRAGCYTLHQRCLASVICYPRKVAAALKGSPIYGCPQLLAECTLHSLNDSLTSKSRKPKTIVFLYGRDAT